MLLLDNFISVCLILYIMTSSCCLAINWNHRQNNTVAWACTGCHHRQFLVQFLLCVTIMHTQFHFYAFVHFNYCWYAEKLVEDVRTKYSWVSTKEPAKQVRATPSADK